MMKKRGIATLLLVGIALALSIGIVSAYYPCSKDSQCLTGGCVKPFCACNVQGDCDSNEHCKQGVCIPPGVCKEDGQCKTGGCVSSSCACNTHGDCYHDEYCTSGLCKAAPVGFCQSDTNCPIDQSCVSERCTPLPEGACRAEETCPENQACIEGKCTCIDNAYISRLGNPSTWPPATPIAELVAYDQILDRIKQDEAKIQDVLCRNQCYRKQLGDGFVQMNCKKPAFLAETGPMTFKEAPVEMPGSSLRQFIQATGNAFVKITGRVVSLLH